MHVVPGSPGFPHKARGPRRGVFRAMSLLLCWLLIVLPLHPAAMAQTGAKPERPRIAVLAFELIDVKKAEGVAAEDQLRNELVKKRVYTVVDRAQTEKVLKELHFQQVGLTEQDKALKLGKLLNVQLIVTGRLTALTGAVQLNVQMIEVQTAEILRSEAILHRGDMLGLIAEEVPLLAARMARVEKPPPDLQRLADTTPVTEPPPAPSPEVGKEEQGGMPWWGWALIGVGAVGIAASSSSSSGGGGGSGGEGTVGFDY